MNKKTNRNVQKTEEQVNSGDDTIIMSKEEVKATLDEIEETNRKLKILGNEIVFKHLLVKKLIDECLKAHRKEHDEQLAQSLYNRFMKELE